MAVKKWLYIGVIGSTLCVLSGCYRIQPEPVAVRAVRTFRLQDQGDTVEREFSGDIRARLETRLSFRVPGKVLKRQVNLGDSFKAGQVLAQLDPADLALNQQAAKAGLLAVQAQAAQAAADFQRSKDLNAQGFISAAQLERYQTSLQAANASLAQARTNVSIQGNQASYSQILADGKGVVISVDAEVGQVVGAGTPIITVAYDGPRDVVFSVPDHLGATMRSIIGKEGLLKARVWGNDQWLPANVREVAAAADGATRTLLVKAGLVDVQSSDVDLGQTAVIAFNEATRSGQGILIPLQALVECQGKSCVWVVNPQSMTVSQQPVVTADFFDNQVLVVKGLQLGQEVVTAGVHILSSGQKIKRLSESSAVNKPLGL